MDEFEVIRDPLWNNIRLDRIALGVLDSGPFQRLRYVRQLGHAFLVYPGATHSRFEHALGAYHLARRTLALLAEREALATVPEDDIVLVRLAALLHDIGHYPFSHALEEAGLPSHELLARERLAHPELAAALAATDVPHVGDRVFALIADRSDSPLQGLISGPLDLDKIEYLTRDARMCGVPYGTVDVDRLIHSLTVAPGPDGRPAVAVHEKGISALESLLFAKYEMYRNVYWHHAVRSATAMFKRVVRTAIGEGVVDADLVAHATDEGLMEALRRGRESELARRLRARRLYKRAVDLPAGAVAQRGGAWLADDPELVGRVEDRLAAELGLQAGELLLDFPAKHRMLDVDVALVTRDGTTQPLAGDRGSGLLSIATIADELHTGARRLRVFTATPVPVRPEVVLALAERTGDEVAAALAADHALL